MCVLLSRARRVFVLSKETLTCIVCASGCNVFRKTSVIREVIYFGKALLWAQSVRRNASCPYTTPTATLRGGALFLRISPGKHDVWPALSSLAAHKVPACHPAACLSNHKFMHPPERPTRTISLKCDLFPHPPTCVSVADRKLGADASSFIVDAASEQMARASTSRPQLSIRPT